MLGFFSLSWDGRRQISYVLGGEDNDSLILVLTPAKKMVTLIKIPKNLEVVTPWFGKYRAGKLFLLAEQEKNNEIVPLSLGYFLGVGIDKNLGKVKLNLSEENLSSRIKKFFFWSGNRNLQVWKYLSNNNLVWKTINLSSGVVEKELPDQSVVSQLPEGYLANNYLEYLTDPLIKEENLLISVFNIGGKQDLAFRVRTIIKSWGGNVIEVANADEETDYACILVLKDEEMQNKILVDRLKNFLDCRVEINDKSEIDVRVLVKNVKI